MAARGRQERGASGEDDKRARRLARKEAAERERRRAHQRRRIGRAAIWIAGVAVVVVGGWILFGPDPEIDGVERPPNRGREHLAQGTPIEYDNPAPTSGPHWPAAPPCRLYNEPLDLELAVHALEHGTVVVWHRPDADDATIDALRRIAASWDSHVIVSPNPGIDEPLVATAWDRRMAFDRPGPDLEEFVDVYRLRGPERVDCPQIR